MCYHSYINMCVWIFAPVSWYRLLTPLSVGGKINPAGTKVPPLLRETWSGRRVRAREWGMGWKGETLALSLSRVLTLKHKALSLLGYNWIAQSRRTKDLSVISEQFTFSAQDVHPARRCNPTAEISTLSERVGQLCSKTTRSTLLLHCWH